jgi:hypothetical protein
LRPAWAKSSQDPISTNNWEKWGAPVIPTTQVAEIRRITVPDQPRKKVHETYLNRETWVWWHIPVTPVMARSKK